MECRFCKLDNIDQLEDKQTYLCPYCGYSFRVSKAAVWYDNIVHLPMGSWLVASILWFSAMLTGVIFGLGFNSSSLKTTILFMYLYGISSLIYGLSVSLDYFSALWRYIKRKLRGEEISFDEVKHEVQKLRKEKIIKEMATGRAIDEATGKFIETDIRPGEKKVPKLAPSFLAGLWTIIVGIVFSIMYSVIFPPLT